MSTDLSPHNEQFIEHEIARGVFHDRTEALDEAVELLRRRQELLDHVDEGTRQLRNGEGIELHGEDELRAFFDRMQDDGMRRYQQCKKRSMNRYTIAPRARADLQAIWDYIGIDNDNPTAASNQLVRFHGKFALLAAQPLMGQLRDDLRPGLRIFVADSYVILYYAVSDGIEVVGVVHAARHIEWLFQSGQR